LQNAFEKYLPAVLNNTATPAAQPKAMLSESRTEVTGDKTAKTNAEYSDSINTVVEFKRLAGLK
jgi:hypothetical protein